MKRILSITLLSIVLLTCREDKIDPTYFSSLVGLVGDADSVNVLANVSITTVPPTEAILTSENGQFLISNIPTGAYAVKAEKEGYSTETVNVTIGKDRTTTITILLKKDDDGGINFEIPFNPSPIDQATGQGRLLTLGWSAPEILNETDLTFDVLLFKSGELNGELVAEGISDTIVVVSDLEFATTYYWQVNTVLSNDVKVPGDLWSFQTIDQPDNRFLFASERSGSYQIYSSDSTGIDEILLTNTSSRDWYPQWSPNRDLIAFTSDRTSESQIYLMQPNGQNLRRLSTLAVDGYHNQGVGFAWSPTGGYVIYSHYEKLFRLDKEGINLTQLSVAPNGRHYRQCDWTGQGNKIVVETVGSVVYDNEIYIMEANGANRQLLVENRKGIVSSPSFTVDGSKILFTYDVSEFESTDGRQLNAHIFLMSVSDTSDVVDLSVNKAPGTNDLQPRISPDGSQVIFVNANNDGSGKKETWIMDIDGDNRHQLFIDAEMPDWQ
ncbi:MAG: carboxypeptidase regulatory-like domain-containing protein [Vicingaceae bacterium]